MAQALLVEALSDLPGQAAIGGACGEESGRLIRRLRSRWARSWRQPHDGSGSHTKDALQLGAPVSVRSALAINDSRLQRQQGLQNRSRARC